MKFKKLLIPALLSLSILSLTSCDYISDFFKDNSSLPDPNSIIDDIINNNPTETESITTVDIDESNVDYGYNDLQNYGDENKKIALTSLYTRIDGILSNFMTSNINLELQSFEVNGVSKNYYIIEKDIIFYDDDNSQYSLTKDEASAAYKAVLLDNPQYYFVDNTLLNSSMSTTNIQGETKEKKYLTIVCDDDYHLSSDRLNYNQQLASYCQTIKTQIGSTKNPISKTIIIHDYIIMHAEYAFKKIGNNYVKYNDSTHSYDVVSNKTDADPDDSSFAHNLLGIVVKHEGVCESYAELFQYLLKDNGIESIIVTGDAWSSLPRTGEGEAHAWNYVKYNVVDGGTTVEKWYGFDVTWDDPVPDRPNQFQTTYFGKVDSSFTDSHQPDVNGDLSEGLKYLYALPTLASSNLYS